MSGFLGDLSKEQEEAVKSLKLKLDELKLTEKMSKTDFEREVLRFLRARKFKVDKTLEMIKKYLEWRETNQFYTKTAADCKDVTWTKAFVYMGKDKENHHTFVVFPAKHIPSSLDYKQVEIMAVLILDNFFEQMDKTQEQINLLFCYDNWGLSCVDRTIDSMFMSIGQDYFPERLHRAFLVNPPWFFSTIWTILKPFLDQKTVEKINFLGDDYKEVLLQHYDEDQLLEVFGGKNKETTAYELMEKYFTKEQLKGFELCKKPRDEPITNQQTGQQTEQTDKSEESSWSSWSFGLL
jgi:hypothetical protein